MSKKIDKFIKELADYINTKIVGTCGTEITHCAVTDTVLNRGHVIPIKVKLSKEVDARFKDMGPAFYAEELMAEFEGRPVSEIAAAVNKRVHDSYSGLVGMLAANTNAATRTLADYPKEDLIVSAIPTSDHQLTNTDNPFINKELSIGLTVAIKGRVCTDPENEDLSYFVPVCEDPAHPTSEKDWKNAHENTLRNADIKTRVIKIPSAVTPGENLAVAGHVADFKDFYDWFYLINPEIAWKDIIKETNAEIIYILPDTPYFAAFLIESPDVMNDGIARAYQETFVDDAGKESHHIMPACVLDCKTMKIHRVM